jgi:TrmH family RNA methyltransferase
MISRSRLKYIQSLGQKKFRDEEGLFIAEGPKIVKEFLQERTFAIKELYATEEWFDDNGSLPPNIEPVRVSEIELERMSQLKTPNQVIAVIEKFPEVLPVVTKKISLVLDTIQDPGNFGTIIRIADWFGIASIISSTGGADMYNPKVVQSAMGSTSRVSIFYTDLSNWLKEQEVPIYAAALDGKDIASMKPPGEALLIIGNESKGVHPELLELATEKITIARKGKAESLNAAIAAGIILSRLT